MSAPSHVIFRLRAPLLLIAGDVSTSQAGRNALQDGSTHGLNVKATTAHLSRASLDIASPGNAIATLRRAIAMPECLG